MRYLCLLARVVTIRLWTVGTHSEERRWRTGSLNSHLSGQPFVYFLFIIMIFYIPIPVPAPSQCRQGITATCFYFCCNSVCPQCFQGKAGACRMRQADGGLHLCSHGGSPSILVHTHQCDTKAIPHILYITPITSLGPQGDLWSTHTEDNGFPSPHNC